MIYPSRCFLKKNFIVQNKLSSQKITSQQNLNFLAFYNSASETSDVSWMDAIFLNSYRVSNCKLVPF